MFGIEQLIDFMEEKFGVVVELNAIGEETVLLYHEELDEKIVPPEVFKSLPNPVIFQTYSYFDKSEWIIGVALEAETNHPLFLICLKDGMNLYQKVFTD